MSETKVRRHGFGEDGIYLDAARNRYLGAVSIGYGPDGKRIRRKVSGKTKQEVRKRRVALALSRTGLAVRVGMAQPALSCLEAGGGVMSGQRSGVAGWPRRSCSSHRLPSGSLNSANDM